MKLEHDFTVPAPIDEAWKVLLDVERIAPCMPGATLLTVDGDDFTGTVKVKVGPIQVTYKGQAKFVERDESGHRAVIEASGKEARGSGTAAATVTTVLVADGDSTRVNVETDLNITGRPAQFGRGVMAEVGTKLIGQFASCLADELGSSAAGSTASPAAGSATPDGTSSTASADEPVQAAAAPPTTAAPVEAAPAPAAPLPPTTSTTAGAESTTSNGSGSGSSGPRIVPPRPAAEPIDLLDVAGGSVAKRLAPVAALVALLLFVVWRRRH